VIGFAIATSDEREARAPKKIAKPNARALPAMMIGKRLFFSGVCDRSFERADDTGSAVDDCDDTPAIIFMSSGECDASLGAEGRLSFGAGTAAA